MRVDLVLPKLKPPSGAERLVLGLGRGMVAQGARVRVVCHQFDEGCQPLAEGLTVVETGIRVDRTGNHYLDSILGYLLSFGLARHLDPEADAVCLFGPALPLAALLRRGAGRRVLYGCYEPPRAVGVDREDVLARLGALRAVIAPLLRLYRYVDRWLVRRADATFVTGPFGAELVRAEYGISSTVVTPGASLDPPEESREECRERLGIDPSAALALTINFLHPRKRVDLLLRAWREVEARVPSARLVIVGDGPERETLAALVQGLGLARVRFTGYISEEDLPRFYRAADLLVHTARLETFGLTIVEAGAFGIPAVAIDEAGPRHTIAQGETGVRVPAEESALAEAVAGLLGDEPRRQQLGSAARRRVSKLYTWERGASDLLRLARGPGG